MQSVEVLWEGLGQLKLMFKSDTDVSMNFATSVAFQFCKFL